MNQQQDEWFHHTGRPPVAESSWLKQFFCIHRETAGQPTMVDKMYADIELVQCERCGRWQYPKRLMRGRTIKLLRNMLGLHE